MNNTVDFEKIKYITNANITSDIITSMVQIIGIFISAYVIIWKMGRQHQSNLLLQKDNLKNELKLDIYKTILDVVHRTRKIHDELDRKSVV